MPQAKQDVPVPSFGDMETCSQTPKQSWTQKCQILTKLASGLKEYSDCFMT